MTASPASASIPGKSVTAFAISCSRLSRSATSLTAHVKVCAKHPLRKVVTIKIAAYLLDRADQYETDSPCWVALGDAAMNVVNGAARVASEHGEFDADLLRRVEGMRLQPERPVDPRAGTENAP